MVLTGADWLVHHSQRLVEVQMREFKFSVIIPVYNAAAYVRHAVESALAQPETAEVILIEDGSPDNALEICENLASEFEKVKLLRHQTVRIEVLSQQEILV